MIPKLALDYDNNAGILTIKDNSLNKDSSVTRAIIKIKEPASRIVLGTSSSPTLTQFLNAGSNIKLAVIQDGVLIVEYILLVPLTNVVYHDKDSSIVKLNIFNETKNFFHIYTGDQLYEIDKVRSTQHELILTRPLSIPGTEVFGAYYAKDCISALYGLSREIKELVLRNIDCNCKNCGTELEKVNKTYMYLEALKFANCEEQEDIIKCLKKLYDISC